MSKSKVEDILLQERIYRDDKFFKVYTVFRPSMTVPFLTPKFYSKQQGIPLDLAKDEYVNFINQHERALPTTKYKHPVTSNHCYGFYYMEDFERSVFTDKILSSRRKADDDIKLAIEMKKSLKKEPPFLGVPFKL